MGRQRHLTRRRGRGEPRRVEPVEGDVEPGGVAEGLQPRRDRGVASAARSSRLRRLDAERRGQRRAVGLRVPGGPHVRSGGGRGNERTRLLARDPEPRQRRAPTPRRNVPLGDGLDRRPAGLELQHRDAQRVPGDGGDEVERDRRRHRGVQLAAEPHLDARAPRPGRPACDDIDRARLEARHPGRVHPPDLAAMQIEAREVERPAASAAGGRRRRGARRPRVARGERARERDPAVRLLLEEHRRGLELDREPHRPRPQRGHVHEHTRAPDVEHEVAVGVEDLQPAKLEPAVREHLDRLELEPSRDGVVEHPDDGGRDRRARERRDREERRRREREAGGGGEGEERPAEAGERARDHPH